ncbi:MAG: hypothetical protein P1U53_14450 [Sulfitobacter sp.]|nr:hypothetical protein [Sulfitobacter sp.]
MLRLALILCLLVPVQPRAQEQITPEEFLDRATGMTLTFRSYRSGRLVGEEQFLRRDLSVWTDVTGRCTYGVIEVRGPLICFIYDDAPDPENCWIIYDDQGEMLVQSLTDLQRITRIEKRDLNCGEAPLS